MARLTEYGAAPASEAAQAQPSWLNVTNAMRAAASVVAVATLGVAYHFGGDRSSGALSAPVTLAAHIPSAAATHSTTLGFELSSHYIHKYGAAGKMCVRGVMLAAGHAGGARAARETASIPALAHAFRRIVVASHRYSFSSPPAAVVVVAVLSLRPRTDGRTPPPPFPLRGTRGRRTTTALSSRMTTRRRSPRTAAATARRT